jgi:hypothetical protein
MNVAIANQPIPRAQTPNQEIQAPAGSEPGALTSA